MTNKHRTPGHRLGMLYGVRLRVIKMKVDEYFIMRVSTDTIPSMGLSINR